MSDDTKPTTSTSTRSQAATGLAPAWRRPPRSLGTAPDGSPLAAVQDADHPPVPPLRGLCWDNPRCHLPLADASAAWTAAVAGRPTVLWETCSLADIETGAIRDRLAGFDLVVLDSATLPEAVADWGVLKPLAALPTTADAYLGQAANAVTVDGTVYGAPVDLSVLVNVIDGNSRLDLPSDFENVAGCYNPLLMGAALADAGAATMLQAILLGRDAAYSPESGWPAIVRMDYALHILYLIRRRSHPDSPTWDSAAASAALRSASRINYLPLVWADLAADVAASKYVAAPPVPNGQSVLQCMVLCATTADTTGAAAELAIWLAKPGIQSRFWPSRGGQPASRRAWHASAAHAHAENPLDPDNPWSRLEPLVEAAWLPPRSPRWRAFQQACATALVAWMAPDHIMDLPDVRVIDEELRAIHKRFHG